MQVAPCRQFHGYIHMPTTTPAKDQRESGEIWSIYTLLPIIVIGQPAGGAKPTSKTGLVRLGYLGARISKQRFQHNTFKPLSVYYSLNQFSRKAIFLKKVLLGGWVYNSEVAVIRFVVV